MARMRRLWGEFKSIAISGNVLDLALGFIIGAAFAKLIESLVGNVFMQLIAALFDQAEFQKLTITVDGTPVRYGAFLTDLLNFVLLAVALFVIVKFMVLVGIERGRSLELRNCPYCLDRVPVGALVCRVCGQQLVDELPSLRDAERQLVERQARRWPTLPRRSAAGPIQPSGSPSDPAATDSRQSD